MSMFVAVAILVVEMRVLVVTECADSVEGY